MENTVLSVTDFVALCNQTLEFAYPIVIIEGEVSSFRVNKNKWVYFDIKDEMSSLRCFGTVYLLPGPLEDGMMVRIKASPRLHPQYNFSLNLQSIQPVGEGSIKRASDLLLSKLQQEGLFDTARKRILPELPTRIGLVASGESAGYSDFIKIIDARFGGVEIFHVNTGVQGEQSAGEIVQAINKLNQLAEPVEVIVVTRGGGSKDDLASFDNEQVVRAVAASRIPTLVAIGHERDTCLAELAADQRASTPSNAAEMLVPDKSVLIKQTNDVRKYSLEILVNFVEIKFNQITQAKSKSKQMINDVFANCENNLNRQRDFAGALNPTAALKRGYAVLKNSNGSIKTVRAVKLGDKISAQLQDGTVNSTVNEVKYNYG